MADNNKPEDSDDFAIDNPGYKMAAAKTVDEYQKLDAGDESLARWKASLGLNAAVGGDTSQPMLSVLALDLTSSDLPKGRSITLDFSSEERRKYHETNPIQVKEGAAYQVVVRFIVNHSIITGVRYMQVTKRKGIRVEKVDSMLGSYGAKPDPQRKVVIDDTFPSGILARGVYDVQSKVIDDDKNVWLDYKWKLEIAKDW